MKTLFVCLVRLCEDQILLVHHKERKGWEFPGGKLESSDLVDTSVNFENLCVYDVLKAAYREYIEETNADNIEMLDFELFRLGGLYFNANVGTLFIVFDAPKHLPEKIIDNDKSIDFAKEFNVNDLPELSFPTDNAVILEILGRHK